MNEVKTEFASMEEHDNVVWKTIERGAYTLYERDGCKDGYDREHWFRAERGTNDSGRPVLALSRMTS